MKNGLDVGGDGDEHDEMAFRKVDGVDGGVEGTVVAVAVAAGVEVVVAATGDLPPR